MPIPLRLPPRTYASATLGVVRNIGPSHISLIAAGVAFFSMLSLFPALAALIAVLSLIADPDIVVTQLNQFRELIPDDVYDIIHAQLVGLVSTSSSTLGWASVISILVAWWSARAGVGAMMHGLNVVYGEKNRASWWHYLRAMLLTAALVAVGIVALLTVIVAPVVLHLLPLGNIAAFVLDALRWIVAVAVIFGGINLLYRYGPNRSGIRIGWLTPGAVFAGITWATVSFAFSKYVSEFGNYNEVYGSIGAVIAMLVWLWISSFVVLLGASLNAQIETRLAASSEQMTKEPAAENTPTRTALAPTEILNS